MSDIVKTNANLPDKIEDLAKFVLFNREKIVAVRAEIRAIDKLHLAQELREQKREEATMLSEVLLDAEVRIGELFKEMPKAIKGNQYTGKMVSNSDVTNQMTKEERINNLGFSKMQASRLETLADNKDIVEFVKAEARENGDFPTRARVFKLINYEKNQEDEDDEYERFIADGAEAYRGLTRIINLIYKYDMSEYRMDALRENFEGALRVEDSIEWIEQAKDKLTLLEVELRKTKKHKFNFRRDLYNN